VSNPEEQSIDQDPREASEGSTAWQRSRALCAELNRPQLEREAAAREELRRRVDDGEEVKFAGRFAWMNNLTPAQRRKVLASRVHESRKALADADALLRGKLQTKPPAEPAPRAPRRTNGSSGRPGGRRTAASSPTSSPDPGDDDDPADDPLCRAWDGFEGAGCEPRGRPWDFMVRCPLPGHGRGRGDRSPSVHVWERSDRAVAVWCHAGCRTEDVVAAVGLTMADLFPRGHHRGHRGEPLPPPRLDREPGPFSYPLSYLSALALVNARASVSIMSPCPACGGDGSWLRADAGGATLDCPDGCDAGAIEAALGKAAKAVSRV
jgi:hypothetical protein